MIKQEDLEKRFSKDPYPVSPFIGDNEIEEIGSLKSEEIAPGIVVIHNAFEIDQDLILSHIDSRAEESHRNRWTYITGEDGNEYGINEDGFRYRPQDVPFTPVRILDPVNGLSENYVKEFFIYLENQIYKSLLKYIDYYPLMLGSIWWKTRGHVLRYGDGGILGCHADNDTNYKVTKGVRYMPKGMVASRQTCGALIYLNDCVDSEDQLNGQNFTGGQLRFVHLGVSYSPKRGDIIFFPTNYVAAHDVEKMGKGVRYTYLTFFGQGSNDQSAHIIISEPEDSKEWCPPVWMNDIYDDYEKYCRSPYSLWSNPKENNLEIGWNPIYQGRNVAQYSQSHDTVFIDKDNSVQSQDNIDEDEGPCGTVPFRIG